MMMNVDEDEEGEEYVDEMKDDVPPSPVCTTWIGGNVTTSLATTSSTS